ncbi:MAG: hypothetical protein II857_06755, partial [Selenomonadaceae bacterium]|nr:hypothetical protein [Selenomonadaceae bacterium]
NLNARHVPNVLCAPNAHHDMNARAGLEISIAATIGRKIPSANPNARRVPNVRVLIKPAANPDETPENENSPARGRTP